MSKSWQQQKLLLHCENLFSLYTLHSTSLGSVFNQINTFIQEYISRKDIYKRFLISNNAVLLNILIYFIYITVILNGNNISQYYSFYLIFGQINAALIERKTNLTDRLLSECGFIVYTYSPSSCRKIWWWFNSTLDARIHKNHPRLT